MYTAPVKFPAQAQHVTKEAVVEVDLPAQMVRAISDLDRWWHHRWYHICVVRSVVKERQHLLLCGEQQLAHTSQVYLSLKGACCNTSSWPPSN